MTARTSSGIRVRPRSAGVTVPPIDCGCMTSTIDRRRLLGTVLIATFIGQFDFFVVNVAAPGIQTSLGAGNTARWSWWSPVMPSCTRRVW